MTVRGERYSPARIATTAGAVFLWSVLILCRLGQLQVLRHQEFSQLALQRQQITRQVIAPRGIIYDSELSELASNVTVSTVVAEPRRIKDIPDTARRLASILGLNRRKLLSRMTDPARQMYIVIKRRIDPAAEAQIEALDLDGVYFVDESMRVYPNRELACHVLGFVNMNGDGGDGLELEYDSLLKGIQGQISFDVDARRRSFRGSVQKPPVQGHSLILSIDKSIQYITERELAAAVVKSRAAAGTAIVLESDSGRVLALANFPNFNCNAYNTISPDLWRNRAVSDFFEPGSTFKVVVATAALEAGLTRPDEPIDCQMGSIAIGGHVFHDHKPYGILTFSEILENSSNVGAAKLGLRLGEQRLYEALRKFGFGSETGVDLPGEIVGLVRDWHDWSGLSIGAISFGQEVGVTSMQILVAINSVANGGYRVRPSIVDRIVDENGDLVEVRTPERERIMSPSTAEAVRNAFEGVVLRGTATQAALEGYRAAGKTGTAQKIVNGHYSGSKYVASFIGFAPLPRPRVTILVQIDEPHSSIYGGSVAAPAFRKIAQETLLQLRIPPDETLPLANPSVAESKRERPSRPAPAAPKAAPADEDAVAVRDDGGIAVAVESGSVQVPDFRGMSKRRAIQWCSELGIRVKTLGSGTASAQEPPPGTMIPPGESCSVTFTRDGGAPQRREDGGNEP